MRQIPLEIDEFKATWPPRARDKLIISFGGPALVDCFSDIVTQKLQANRHRMTGNTDQTVSKDVVY